MNFANLRKTVTDVGSAAQAAAAVGITGLLAEAIGREAKKAIDVAHTEKNLIAVNPELAQYDQSKVKDYFDVVKLYSPQAARNPLVAGQLVNKMIQFGGVDHKLVQDIAGLEEKSRSNVGDHLGMMMGFSPISVKGEQA